jgi:hypothetical protein
LDFPLRALVTANTSRWSLEIRYFSETAVSGNFLIAGISVGYRLPQIFIVAVKTVEESTEMISPYRQIFVRELKSYQNSLRELCSGRRLQYG